MDELVSWSRRVRFPPIGDSVGKARDFTTLHLSDHDLEGLIDDVRLVTSELVTNAIQHAKTAFTVVLEGDTRMVRVTVSDESASRPSLTTPTASDAEGWGLRIVQSISHDWGVVDRTRTGKSVWATFAVSDYAVLSHYLGEGVAPELDGPPPQPGRGRR